MLPSNDTMSRLDAAILAMSPADIERFWSKVDKTPGQGPKGVCWIWTGYRDKFGYGKFKVAGAHGYAHRIAYFLGVGILPPPESPCVLHSCDMAACVNFNECLWAGTDAENIADREAKGRTARGDRGGSRLHPERVPRGDNHPARLHPERMARGEQNGCAKLTDASVSDAKTRFAAGSTTYSALAREFGVSPVTMRRAVLGETWGHIG